MCQQGSRRPDDEAVNARQSMVRGEEEAAAAVTVQEEPSEFRENAPGPERLQVLRKDASI